MLVAQLCPTLYDPIWTIAHQAPLSIEFSRQEYWSGLLFPFPGYLLNPEIEPGSPALWADSLPSEPPGKPRERKTQREKENRVLCLLPYPLMISLEAEGGE